MHRVMTLNGTVTHEDCPVCGGPEMKVEHGRWTSLWEDPELDYGPGHVEWCEWCERDDPDYDGSMAIVCYDCEHCPPFPDKVQMCARCHQPVRDRVGALLHSWCFIAALCDELVQRVDPDDPASATLALIHVLQQVRDADSLPGSHRDG